MVNHTNCEREIVHGRFLSTLLNTDVDATSRSSEPRQPDLSTAFRMDSAAEYAGEFCERAVIVEKVVCLDDASVDDRFRVMALDGRVHAECPYPSELIVSVTEFG